MYNLCAPGLRLLLHCQKKQKSIAWLFLPFDSLSCDFRPKKCTTFITVTSFSLFIASMVENGSNVSHYKKFFISEVSLLAYDYAKVSSECIKSDLIIWRPRSKVYEVICLSTKTEYNYLFYHLKQYTFIGELPFLKKNLNLLCKGTFMASKVRLRLISTLVKSFKIASNYF